MTPITRTLAQYAAASRYDELPEAVRHEGVRAFVNFVGCAAGGAREPVAERMLAVVSEFNGGPHATVIGRRERVDTLNAALINSAAQPSLPARLSGTTVEK